MTNLELAQRITIDDLPRPTPCDAWDLGELLAHMTGRKRGFAAAAKGWRADLAGWAPMPVSAAAPDQGYAASVHAVLHAFLVAVELGQGMRVPEVDAEHDFPASTAVGFYLVDTVAHGWDVARALDLPFEVDDDALAAASLIATNIPEDEHRGTPFALFAPRVAHLDGSPLAHFRGLVGRASSWAPTGEFAASEVGP
jgi:uncharacterized protein (TIGR03086 family)